jgi:hypothetical protein
MDTLLLVLSAAISFLAGVMLGAFLGFWMGEKMHHDQRRWWQQPEPLPAHLESYLRELYNSRARVRLLCHPEADTADAFWAAVRGDN